MTTLKKGFGVFILWVLMTVVCPAQTIKGIVTDSLGKAVPFAGVNLKTNNLIVGYTTTNEKGNFLLPVPAGTNQTGLTLEISCIGFKKASKPVADFSKPYDFKLTASVNALKTVTIRDNSKIRTSGDTISYKVAEFTQPQDRTIGDVIKKLPGMDVDKNGKISYNGKAISNLYIGGDNLLDDRYNIATRTIPNGVVDEVQVMENHQPVKMLKNKVNSDDVALNLTIKKDAKMQLVGQETVGAGLPGNYDAELNAMLFKDQYKAINYLKGNNTGYDLQSDVISHNLADYLSRVDNDKPSTVLSMGTAGDPDLPRNRYLLNRSGVLNLNNLYKPRPDVQLRANLSYLTDNQRQVYSKLSEVYLPNDTIRYTENQYNKARPDILHAQLYANYNKDKYYLNNSFAADYSHGMYYSSLVSNNVPVNQVFKDNLVDIANQFNLMQTFRHNNIIELYSYLNRTSEPENRVIDPGFNPAVFNNGVPYALLTQNVNIPSWFTNNYVKLTLPKTLVTQSYKVGFSLQSQRLQSALTTTQLNNQLNQVGDSALNNLNWSRRKLYAEAGYDIPGNVLKVTASLPVNLMQIAYNDAYYQLNKSLTRLYFNPRLSVKYQTGAEDYLTAIYSLRNDIGGIQDVYNGSILKNYRTLYANNADLTERKTQNANLGYSYRKAISLFFFSVNAGYTHQAANNITSSVLTNNLQQRIVLPFNNQTDAWDVSGAISKYHFKLRTTFAAGASYQTARLNQIQNGIILPYTTISTSFVASADTKVSAQVNFNYKANFSLVTSKSDLVPTESRFQRLIQQAALNYTPSANFLIGVSADHYYTRQQQAGDLKYIFADASLRYKINKLRTDIELSAKNLFNMQNYSAVYLSANVFTSSTYSIPGRIILAKVMFNI